MSTSQDIMKIPKNLLVTIVTKNSQKKVIIVCTFGNCKLTFSRRDVLVRHVRGVHDKKKPHNCEKCEKTYSLKSHLNEHISTFHENIKKFACDICDKKFTEKKSLLGTLSRIYFVITWVH